MLRKIYLEFEWFVLERRLQPPKGFTVRSMPTRLRVASIKLNVAVAGYAFRALFTNERVCLIADS